MSRKRSAVERNQKARSGIYQMMGKREKFCVRHVVVQQKCAAKLLHNTL
jgi:hypothetical protein